MAMEIIAKEKKDIQWKGLPRGHSSTTDRLRGERARLTEQLQKQQEFIGVGAHGDGVGRFCYAACSRQITWHTPFHKQQTWGQPGSQSS